MGLYGTYDHNNGSNNIMRPYNQSKPLKRRVMWSSLQTMYMLTNQILYLWTPAKALISLFKNISIFDHGIFLFSFMALTWYSQICLGSLLTSIRQSYTFTIWFVRIVRLFLRILLIRNFLGKGIGTGVPTLFDG